MATAQVVRSEWTKIRSVASTVWTLSSAVVVTIALGMLISALSRSEFDNLDRREQLSFDPTFISFAGTSLGQLAMIVFGVLVVSNEYSTGMIRASLAAVPRRGSSCSASSPWPPCWRSRSAWPPASPPSSSAS